MRGLFLGIAIGFFVTGVIRLMNVANNLPFVIIGGILIGLFVYPKSPIIRHIYPISGKLSIGL